MDEREIRGLPVHVPVDPSGGEDPVQVLRDVSVRIAELRRRAGLTQAQVARRLRIALRNYQRFELGRENFTLTTLVRIGGVLAARVRDLLDEPTSAAAKRGRPREAPEAEGDPLVAELRVALAPYQGASPAVKAALVAAVRAYLLGGGS
jgi:putative transcriptional regulator